MASTSPKSPSPCPHYHHHPHLPTPFPCEQPDTLQPWSPAVPRRRHRHTVDHHRININFNIHGSNQRVQRLLTCRNQHPTVLQQCHAMVVSP
jgi:hypothetical protein